MNFRYYLLITSLLAGMLTLRAMEEETITFEMPHTPIMQTESVDFSAISQASINTTAPKKESLPPQRKNEPIVLEEADYFFKLGRLLPMRLDPTTKQEDIDNMQQSYQEWKSIRPLTPVVCYSRADAIAAQRMERRNALIQERNQARILRDAVKAAQDAKEAEIRAEYNAVKALEKLAKDMERLVPLVKESAEQSIEMAWQDCTPSHLKQFEPSQAPEDTDGK